MSQCRLPLKFPTTVLSEIKRLKYFLKFNHLPSAGKNTCNHSNTVIEDHVLCYSEFLQVFSAEEKDQLCILTAAVPG